MAIKGGRNRFWEKVRKDEPRLRVACVKLFGHDGGRENYEVMPKKNVFEFYVADGGGRKEFLQLDTILNLGDGRVYACAEYHGCVIFSVWDEKMLDEMEFEEA